MKENQDALEGTTLKRLVVDGLGYPLQPYLTFYFTNDYVEEPELSIVTQPFSRVSVQTRNWYDSSLLLPLLDFLKSQSTPLFKVIFTPTDDYSHMNAEVIIFQPIAGWAAMEKYKDLSFGLMCMQIVERLKVQLLKGGRLVI